MGMGDPVILGREAPGMPTEALAEGPLPWLWQVPRTVGSGPAEQRGPRTSGCLL